MPHGQLRAIVYVPIRFVHDRKKESHAPRNAPTLRPAVSEKTSWADGPLDILTQNRIPGVPFNRSIYIDLPPQLRSFLGYQAISYDDLRTMGKQIITRKHLNLVDNPLHSGIDGLYCDAVELFNFPLKFDYRNNEDDLGLLALHIIASDAPTNVDHIESLARIHNKPIRLILNTLFRTNFEGDIALDEKSSGLPNIYDQNLESGGKSQYELSVNNPWIIVPEIERMNLIIYSSGHESKVSFAGGNFLITDDMSDQNLARFRSKMTFLGALISILKTQSDIFQQKWPVLLEKTDTEVIEIRSWLEAFINAWWWKNISYDEYLQNSYQKWVEALRIDSVFESCRSDLREFWAIRTMLKSVEAAEKSTQDLEELSRLNDLAKLFAIFGIIPAWLGLFLSDLPKLVAPVASLAIIAYMAIRPQKIFKVVVMLQNRMKAK